jgi:hypothetical protein
MEVLDELLELLLELPELAAVLVWMLFKYEVVSSMSIASSFRCIFPVISAAKRFAAGDLRPGMRRRQSA